MVPSRFGRIGILTAALCLTGLWARVGIHTWLAERAANADQFQSALRWRPDIADYWRERAAQLSFDNPSRARTFALRATQLSPRIWKNWQVLGLIDLQRSDPSAAFADFQQGVRYSHTFDAHLEEANLAFLLGDNADSWRQLTAAFQLINAAEVPSAMALASRFAADHPEKIRQLVPPQKPQVALAMIETLLHRTEWLPAAVLTWQRVTCSGNLNGDCKDAFMALTNALIQKSLALNGSPQATKLLVQAMDVWNDGQRKGLADEPIRLGQITNGQFHSTWSEGGFGWIDSRQVASSINDSSGGPNGSGYAEFDFNPEARRGEILLFYQIIAVKPGQIYHLSLASRSDNNTQDAGYAISIRSGSGNHILASGEFTAASNWHTNSLTWKSPDTLQPLLLEIWYKRPTGHLLLRGHLDFSDIALREGAQ